MDTPLWVVLNALAVLYESEASAYAARLKKQMLNVMSEIKDISKQAHVVAFSAQIVAARSGNSAREFRAVANVLPQLTGELDKLVQQAIGFDQP
ncbi:MAG: hypothetical protein JO006_01045 [Paucibacter sp.]|nr:hypothetical protein [Roseateles sp.]